MGHMKVRGAAARTFYVCHKGVSDPEHWGGRADDNLCPLVFCCFISSSQRLGEEKQSTREETLQHFAADRHVSSGGGADPLTDPLTIY